MASENFLEMLDDSEMAAREENQSVILIDARRPSIDIEVDYFFAVTDLEAVRQSWIDDGAFYPSTVTFGLTFAFGLIGNILVLVALLGDRRSTRNLTTVLMMSLAIADLLFLLVCVPYEMANKLSWHWSGGVPVSFCKLTGYVEMLSALASVLNLTAVSVER